jgi:hypothetical protein
LIFFGNGDDGDAWKITQMDAFVSYFYMFLERWERWGGPEVRVVQSSKIILYASFEAALIKS